ncbi:MAG: hypothetical protein ACTIKR_07605 [Advenella sp.]|uniref:Uncharacterized protein n=1 Tax=Advenella kashmirensis TaxID=310575 RepID=A0A356LHM7_9BURK|nr:hypothetical protein [Advenella kashmirensis]
MIDRTDIRVIGVGISCIALVVDGMRHEIELNDSALSGFNEAQKINGMLMRWTTGEAVIPKIQLPSLKGPMALELTVLRTHMYWTSSLQQKARKAA